MGFLFSSNNLKPPPPSPLKCRFDDLTTSTDDLGGFSGEKENMLVTRIFSFSHICFLSFIIQSLRLRYIYLSSANALKLDLCKKKNCHLEKELNRSPRILDKKAVEKNCGKRRKCSLPAFFPFPTM